MRNAKRTNPDSAARFTAYLKWLTPAVGHADRARPLSDYCTGLLLEGERKSIEPMAAKLAPRRVSKKHQSLHHFIADAPWDDAKLLQRVREYVLPRLEDRDPLRYWIIDDTGMPKKGVHSVGVARQYCGVLGKTENCQVAVSLSAAGANWSLPLNYRLYLPESWATDLARREKAGVPDAIGFQTKPAIALDLLKQAVAAGLAPGVVLADAAYGDETAWREGVAGLGLQYAVGVRPATTAWSAGDGPLPPKPQAGRGRPATRARRSPAHRPASLKALAQAAKKTFRSVTWREGTKGAMQSRFAALRVRAAHRDERSGPARAEEWLLVEWPARAAEPARYWLSNLPANTRLKALVATVKGRWRIERDYQELKSEIGLDHFEGRGWRGFHHHASVCIAAYGFLAAERGLFPPAA